MKTSQIILALLFFSLDVFACDSPIATSTIYYTPSALKVCGKWYYGKVRDKKEPWTFNATEKVCPAFEKAVKLEGSGHYNPNEVYTYDHEVMPLTGRAKKPDCPTSVGRSGRCLLTYISVAADTKYNPLGTYISMPSLKGKKLTLPDGSTFTHPGYLRVDDIGSAIKGSKNRFDFYSGNMDEPDKKNSFGLNAPDDTRMSEFTECPKRKTFQKLTDPAEIAKAKKAIEEATRNLSYASVLGVSAGPNNGPYPATTNKINKGVGHSN